MQFRRRLRSRIVLSFLLFGTLLSALFALSTLFLQNYLEDQLIGATLKQELDDYVTQLRLDPSVVEPFYTGIQGYITRPGDPNHTVSPEVRNLPTGVHHDLTEARARGIRIPSQNKVLRVDLLSGARVNTAVPAVLAPPADGFSVDVSLVSLLAIARAEAFKGGPLALGTLAEPTALEFEGEDFRVGLRLWKTSLFLKMVYS